MGHAQKQDKAKIMLPTYLSILHLKSLRRQYVVFDCVGDGSAGSESPTLKNTLYSHTWNKCRPFIALLCAPEYIPPLILVQHPDLHSKAGNSWQCPLVKFNGKRRQFRNFPNHSQRLSANAAITCYNAFNTSNTANQENKPISTRWPFRFFNILNFWRPLEKNTENVPVFCCWYGHFISFEFTQNPLLLHSRNADSFVSIS